MNYLEIDKKLVPILRKMEQDGIKINTKLLNEMSFNINLKIEQLEQNIYNSVGQQVNLNSPSQLAQLLYNNLKIKPKKSGIKQGKQHFSTSASSLGKIKHLHPCISKILEYRELSKLKNTYLDPLPKLVDKNDRLHTKYSLDTSTGRLSSSNPNLQNIPIRNELGKKVRSAFIAKEGCSLVKADYSQIELRVVAHLSSDEEMLKIFRDGKDIHRETAKEMGCDRRTAKVVNFGVLYGMSAFGLSSALKIPVEEAQLFIDKYFLTYSNVKKYFDSVINFAKEKGYVETLYGRKREIKQLKLKNKYLYNFGIRTAINTPVQGSAAEIIKLAMIDLNKKIISNECNMILQVHDELVFEVKNEHIKKYEKIIKDSMENIVKLKIPLVVNLYTGKNWDM